MLSKNLISVLKKISSKKKKKEIEIPRRIDDKNVLIQGSSKSSFWRKNPAEECLFWSCSNHSILKRKLCEKFLDHKFIANELIRQAVEETISELKTKVSEKESEKATEESSMQSLFHCKCGWLLFNAVTLPCGHTVCKQCFDESMICLHCGDMLETKCSSSTFLGEIISLWFSNEFEATKLKRDSKTFLINKKFKKALTFINKSLALYGNDYTALILRSEIYTNLRQHKDALRDAELACKLNTSDGKAQFRRGVCYSNIGDLNTAIDAFQLCLELSSEDAVLSNAVIENIDKILSPAELLLDDAVKEPEEPVESLEDTDEESDIDETNPLCSISKLDESVKKCNSKEVKEVNNHSHKSNFLNSTDTNELKTEETSDNVQEPNTESVNLNILNHAANESRFCSVQKETDISSNLNAEDKSVTKLHGVPINLLKEEDMECRLCYDLLYKPVTTPCGHVFCKNCLLRTLDHCPNCPICRVSLKDYMSNPAKPVTEVIDQILKIYFGKQFNERDMAYRDRIEQLSRVGMDENVEVPVFVCSIAFPYVKCPLHIFEPKYRLMIRDCLESGSRKFGMCMPKSGQNSDGEYADIGTIVEIVTIQTLPDGRFIVNTIAGQRFTVCSKSTRDTLDYAKVTYFCDEPEDLNMERFSTTSRQIYDQLITYINMLKSAEKDCIFNALGTLPSYEHDHAIFQHGVPWIWWGLAALPLNLSAKLVLLRSKCVSERMFSLQRFLRFLITLNPPASSNNNA